MIGMRKTTRNNTEKGSMNSQPVVASCRLLRVRFASLGAGNGAWSNSAMVVLQGWVSAESALTHGRHSLLSNGEVEILHRPNDRLLRRGEDVGYRGRSRGSVRCGLVHLRQGGETGGEAEVGVKVLGRFREFPKDVLATELAFHLLAGVRGVGRRRDDESLPCVVVELGVEPGVELHRLCGVFTALDPRAAGTAAGPGDLTRSETGQLRTPPLPFGVGPVEGVEEEAGFLGRAHVADEFAIG